jgi:putative cardiolipin synthase
VTALCLKLARSWSCATLIAIVAGCAGLPPGADYPRQASSALAHPERTPLGAHYAAAATEHAEASGFHILNDGVDGFLTRVQLIDAAEQTLDLQYFIFRGDETGRLITAALLRAADRGVHIRILVDDGDTVPGDQQILALDGHPGVEVRVFNPFRYRGHALLPRSVEFLFNIRRLDYRMHNKMLVADNAAALIGGRNIGNQYFQMDPQSQFADDDLFSVGPIVTQLSATFDEFWNSTLSIPAAALVAGHHAAALRQSPEAPRGGDPLQRLDSPGIDYAAMVASDEPVASLISGRTPLVWATARVIADSPEKKAVLNGTRRGRLMALSVEQAASEVQGELLMITPYFIPSPDEIALLDTLLRRNVRVALLTNSLSSAPDLVAQAGYAHYRVPMLEDGADLYEVRARIGRRRGSGQTTRISSFGNFGLHAKVFTFDRQRLFLGSMNFDRRSRRLNTEIGVIIDSPALAQQMVTRFEDLTRPENVYEVSLRGSGLGPGMVWGTVENGHPVEYTDEPARSHWQRLKMKFLEWIPLGDEL